MIEDITRYGFRAVHPDFRSRNGYVWPFPGQVAHASGPFDVGNTGGCPRHDGDGICLATTAQGAASGGIPLITVLVCEYNVADVLGSENHESKIRVRKAKVLSVHDFPAILRLAGGAIGSEHLPTKANLSGADLIGADISGADLRYANLSGANLIGADISGANLRYANLRGAYLRGADLRYADLRYADLRYADLRGAYLSGADLYGANLYGADLPSFHVFRDGKVVPA